MFSNRKLTANPLLLARFAFHSTKSELRISVANIQKNYYVEKKSQNQSSLSKGFNIGGGMSARQRVIRLFGSKNKLTELENAVKYEDLTHTKDEKKKWKGIINLKWPFAIDLEIIDQSKQLVTNKLYQNIMEILEKKGCFEIKRSNIQELKKSTNLQLTDESRAKLKQLLTSFRDLKQNLQEIVESRRNILLDSKSLSVENENDGGEKSISIIDNELSDVITGYPLNQASLSMENTDFRNLALFSRWRKLKNDLRPKIREILSDRQSLPIYSVKDEFLDAVNNNRVVLLQGDTGCGKTTQIPQIILENFIENMNGSACNVVVTQPRRISAISVAERISFERNEPIGDTVGYRVRLKQKCPTGNGSILFTTPGMLLRSRFGNPNFKGVSHVIVDEVHERDIWTDFLLISLKRAMKVNENFKIVLMSATFGIEKFQEYFSNCPVVETLGRKFDVEEFFLEDIYKSLNRNSSPKVYTVNEQNVRLPTDIKICVDTIRYIHETQPPGAVLCFLPTIADIKAVHKDICELVNLTDDILVLDCHSKLPIDEQQKIFSTPPDGIRKIVLATNIAETSITIKDVRYVVNSGTHKSHVFDPDSESMRAIETYACRAAQVQRKGRAGRAAKGRCYHLFPKGLWDTLDENFVPELLRNQLSNVVLLAKVFSPDEDPAEFLADALDPPNHYQIENAVEEMMEMKFFDEKRNLTPQGRLLSQFGCAPMLSKAMLYGLVLKCIDPILSISSICESRQNFFTPTFQELDKTKQLEVIKNLMGSSCSDYIFFTKLFEIYRNKFKSSDGETKFNQSYFNENSFIHVEGLRRLFTREIVSVGLCEKDEDILNSDQDLNLFKNNEILIKCAMAAGSHQNLLLCRTSTLTSSSRSKFIFFDQFRRPVHNLGLSAAGSMVKNTEKMPPGQLFNCFDKVLDAEGRSFKVDGLSMLNPLAAILFSGFSLNESDMLNISLEPSVNLKFRFENAKDKKYMLELRDVIEEFVELFCLRVEEEMADSQNQIKFRDFHKNLLETLICLLNADSNK